MKKTLTVNINGIVFHIDEDAFNVLNNYLQSIKVHFSRTQGGEEIVSDIEARIAEMLKEKIGDERQVITIDDVENVINVIGQPSEFGEEFSENQSEPGSKTYETTKRLYRDSERSILGGVCSGLGAYFHTDPIWFRLAFVILSIPGIGTPLLLYVILWIVLPEAKTAAERLEMKGEKINISNIEASIREEIGNLKNKFNNLKNEARRTYKKKSADHRSDIEGVGNTLSRLAELFIKMILVFSGVILFLLGLSFILLLAVLLFGFGQDIFIVDSELVFVSFPALVDFFLGSVGSSLLFKPAFFMLIGIPVFMIVYAGVKLIFGIDRTRFVGITALNLWILALIVTGYYGFKVFKSFSNSGVYVQSQTVQPAPDNLIWLDVNENDKFERYYRYNEYVEIDESNMIITNDENDFFYGIPKLEIVKSHNDKAEVEVFFRARGKSGFQAEERAKMTKFDYVVSEGNITFDRFFKLDDNEVWRDQQVDIVLKLPVGYYVYLSENMYSILNEYRHSQYRLSGEMWVMTEDGLEESDLEPSLVPQINIEDSEELPVNGEEGSISAPASQVTITGIIFRQFIALFGYIA
ncbi:MAG: PspC domain-containing protein [Bacteroidales bacterium]|nr:PspC domain-containing protein [Bacteroidales bacterium]MCF8402404.1 PspC domain-containing protein [Bacteroidales bacterium]